VILAHSPLQVVAASSSDGNEGPGANVFGRAFAALMGGNSNGNGQAGKAQGGAGSGGSEGAQANSHSSSAAGSSAMLTRLGPSAHPSVIAAALVADRDSAQPKGEFPEAAVTDPPSSPAFASVAADASGPGVVASAAATDTLHVSETSGGAPSGECTVRLPLVQCGC
jgi:hypothetical protein